MTGLVLACILSRDQFARFKISLVGVDVVDKIVPLFSDTTKAIPVSSEKSFVTKGTEA